MTRKYIKGSPAEAHFLRKRNKGIELSKMFARRRLEKEHEELKGKVEKWETYFQECEIDRAKAYGEMMANFFEENEKYNELHKKYITALGEINKNSGIQGMQQTAIDRLMEENGHLRSKLMIIRNWCKDKETLLAEPVLELLNK